MGMRQTALVEHEFYHVYNRGADKRVIFQDEKDYQRFMGLLFLSNASQAINVRNILRHRDQLYAFDRGEQLVSIGAYCLMPNHFHLLIQPKVEGGVSAFMKKLGTGYSMYFNKKYDRSGTLFEVRFKAKHAATDEYLKYLYAYIHLNPIKLFTDDYTADTRLNTLKRYQFSSYVDYLSESPVRLEAAIISPDQFPGYFQTASEHVEELREWLTYSPSA
jgi:putative transposase